MSASGETVRAAVARLVKLGVHAEARPRIITWPARAGAGWEIFLGHRWYEFSTEQDATRAAELAMAAATSRAAELTMAAASEAAVRMRTGQLPHDWTEDSP